MSIELMTKVWKYRTQLTPVQKFVLFCLADHANNSGYCFPSQETIAYNCEVSRRTVVRVIKELESLGFIEVRRQQVAQKITKNHYHVLVPPKQSDKSGSDDQSDKSGEASKCQTRHNKVTNQAHQSDKSGTDHTSDVTGTTNEPPVNSNITGAHPANTPSTDLSQDDDEMFKQSDVEQASSDQAAPLPERNAKDLLSLHAMMIGINKEDRGNGVTKLKVCQKIISKYGWDASNDYLDSLTTAQWSSQILAGMAEQAERDNTPHDPGLMDAVDQCLACFDDDEE